MAAATETSILLTNEHDRAIHLVVEPWYAEFLAPAGSRIEIVASSAEEGEHEFEVTDGEITVWLWSGCTAKVTIDGVDVTGEQMAAPSPAFPQGMSPRCFMEVTGLSDIKVPTIPVDYDGPDR